MNYDYAGQYIVIDLEFSKERNKTEIFELAAKKIYTTRYGERIIEGDKFRRIIKPHNIPSNSILSLTGVSRDEILSSINFSEVFKEFLKWIHKDNLETLYVSWGPRDSAVLRVNCKDNGFEKEFNEMTFIDLQSYIMEQENFQQLPSLMQIVEKEFGEFKGTEHHASYDAINTAMLLQKRLENMNKI
jgi:inhibitor of KinA sporulation pathway (predicted exonuclease)